MSTPGAGSSQGSGQGHDQGKVSVPELSLPKGGGSIHGINQSVGVDGATGMATLSFPMPLPAGRGFSPSLALSYSSGSGNGPFGLGWSAGAAAISRSTLGGTPRYDDDDEFMGPGGELLVVKLGTDGQPSERRADTFRQLSLGQTYVIKRFMSRAAGFDTIELWSPGADFRHPDCFWVVQGVDGGVHLFGKTKEGRISDPAPAGGGNDTAQWLLQESVSPTGEHILYRYFGEDAYRPDPSPTGHEGARARYLQWILYGNSLHEPYPYLWKFRGLVELSMPGTFLYQVLFDYGEPQETRSRSPTQQELPDSAGHVVGARSYPERQDPFSHYGFGFDIRCRLLCRRILWYTTLPQGHMTSYRSLVGGVSLGYEESPYASQLASLTHFGCLGHAPGADQRAELIESMPPVLFTYTSFGELPGSREFVSVKDDWPLFPDAEPYQLVDLYGEGVPGILFRSETGWHYRAPLRDTNLEPPGMSGSSDSSGADTVELGDRIKYDAWRPLPQMPAGLAASRGALADVTGDGRLDWVISAPGLAGFFSQLPDTHWTGFTPFAAMPTEFLSADAQWADLAGKGLMDLALIGPRSVRLYLNECADGFAAPRQVPHEGTPLPMTSTARDELVAFSDVLGSGQHHLVRVRHDAGLCWPNLGHGRFGEPIDFARLSLSQAYFNPSSVFLVDIDGSGAADLIYAEPGGLRIFRNHCGNGFADPVFLAFPEGVRYDRLARLNFGDLTGTGCVSVVLSNAFADIKHVRLDFAPAGKPYLLNSFSSGLGMAVNIGYRSSAQEWLDEKFLAPGAVSHLPFPVHLASTIMHRDTITKNQMTQRYRYRHGYYDGTEREFRGFGLVLHVDSENFDKNGDKHDESFCQPVLTKTWYHTGDAASTDHTREYDSADVHQMHLAGPWLCRQIFQDGTLPEGFPTAQDLDAALADATARQMRRALKGTALRSEIFALDDKGHHGAPFTVEEARSAVRLVQPAAPRRKAVVQLLPLESLHLKYDQVADDPVCAHSLTLAWDRYGAATRTTAIAYGRREAVECHLPEPAATWWTHAKDSSQYVCWITEELIERIHLESDDGASRLGLPYLSSKFAWQLPGRSLPQDHEFSYEALSRAGGEMDRPNKELLGQQQVIYQDDTGQEMAAGTATTEALVHHVETAELDKNALHAYDGVWSGDELRAELLAAGYVERNLLLPPNEAEKLWVIQHDFARYSAPEKFRRTVAFRPFSTLGESLVDYDQYWHSAVRVTDAVGNATSAEYDYRLGVVTRIVDPNENSQEARYDGFGRVIATSFYGTEYGKPAGFDALAGWEPGEGMLADALADPQGAIGRIATRHFYDLSRLPIVSASLVADQYATHAEPDPEPGDSRPPAPPIDWPAMQVRIALAYTDGFGRALQSLTKTEPGAAYCRDQKGCLTCGEKGLVEAPTDTRWVVSGRIEYNNKGLPVRTYQPFFIDSDQYVDDAALRTHGYFQRHFYDAVGREIRTINAGDVSMRRQTFHPWYTIHEDENDTYEEFMAGKTAPDKPPDKPAE
jgi:hypothetical protein